jgi:dipeptidyl aminopeptidase/acylaminoacyl peptidase
MDGDGAVRVASGWTHKVEPDVRWRKADGDWAALALPGFDMESIVPLHFDSDGHSMLMTAVRSGQTLSALHRFDLESASAASLYSFDNEGVDVSGLVMDFTGHEPIGVQAYADRNVYHWLRPDDPAAIAYMQLQRAFADQNVRITSASHDGRLAIVRVDSDVNPGDYYLFDTKTAKADFLYGTRTWIDPRQMRPKQPFAITARDGLTLHGYVTRPSGEGPFPLVVLPHDGPHDVRDYWEFDPQVQLLANRGYAVLQLNFRGSAGYGSRFREAGYRQWGGRMQDDLTDATLWAVAQGIAHKDRICIYGLGFGGYAALMGAVREPDLYRCVISYGEVYDLAAVLDSDYLPGRAGAFLLSRMLGEDRADLRSRSPLRNVERIRAPVLLIQGTQDRRVSGPQVERMKWALKMADKPVDVMTLSGEGSQPYGEDNRRAMYERVLGFLEQHLQSPSAAPSP